jgi:hypothetical protein
MQGSLCEMTEEKAAIFMRFPDRGEFPIGAGRSLLMDGVRLSPPHRFSVSPCQVCSSSSGSWRRRRGASNNLLPPSASASMADRAWGPASSGTSSKVNARLDLFVSSLFFPLKFVIHQIANLQLLLYPPSDHWILAPRIMPLVVFIFQGGLLTILDSTDIKRWESF